MILIVGATGSLGGSVARQLLERGAEVRAVARPASPLRSRGRFTDPGELESLGAELVKADLLQPSSLEPHLRGVRVVLSTASGTKRAAPDTIHAVDLEGTAALAAHARQAGVEHFVYVSARGAGPEAPPFLRVKWEAEQAVVREGPPATLVRPAKFMQDWIGFVYGAQLHGGTRVQLVGASDPERAYADEADVAKLLTEIVLREPPSPGGAHRTLEFAADSARTSDIVGRMAAASGLPLTLDRIPVGRTVDTVGEPLATGITQLLTMMADEPDDQVSRGGKERYGFEPRTVDDFVAALFQSAPTP